MKDILTSLKSVGFLNKQNFEKLSTEENWSSEQALDRLKKANEVPIVYILALRSIPNQEDQRKAILRINQLYLFARSKKDSTLKAKIWMENGKIAEGSSSGITSMTMLKTLANKVAKNADLLEKSKVKIKEFEQVLKEESENKRAIKGIETAETRIRDKEPKFFEDLKQFLYCLETLETTIGSEKS